ncbi:MAG TPA: FecR domain-containing protein [Spirochaetota bacterium]|nr:FecR domain-containing protein [Spirochaetota bacterium]
MKKSTLLLILAVSFALISIDASARIVVEKVKGSVAFKAGNQWQPLTEGMALNEGAKISTGVNSTAVIKMDSHTVTINPLTMIKIYENSMTARTSDNRIGLRRGTIRAQVSKDKRIKTVFKVSTPVATSSVRGTEEIISYGPSSGMKIYMIEGVAEGQSNNGNSSTLRGGLVFQQKPGGAAIENPMGAIKGNALAQIGDKNLSADEKKILDFLGIDESQLPGGVLDRLSALMGTNSLVNVIINWP